MAQHVISRFKKTAVLGLSALVLGIGFGCAKKAPVPVAVSQPPVTPAPAVATPACEPARKSLYDQGVCAYDSGDIQQALMLWREAARVETDQAVRRRALFAVAAVRLAQAGNDTDFSAAMDLMEAWTKASPPGGSGEDPRFLLPALRSLHPAFALKEQKATLERECAKKLVEREEQVKKSLQQQVRALETIHQQIQEKKKGLTNY